MLSLWLSFIPDWLTFVHIWRVELFASVFLLFTLIWVIYRASRSERTPFLFSAEEWKFLILPILAFIVWSGASAAWGTSWKSAVHHTLVWIVYLIFYVIIRDSLDRNGGYRRMMNVLVAVLLMYALPAVAGYFALGAFGGANTLGIRFARFGEQAIVILPLLIAGVVALKGRKFVIGVLCTVGLWLLIYCGSGRAGNSLFILGVAATGGMIFVIRKYRVHRTKFVITGAALLAATVLLAFIPFFLSPSEPSTGKLFRDEAAWSSSNDFRKLMISLSAEMFAAQPLLGIGADNFGFQANQFREAHAAAHPDDPNLAQAENDIPERAHNEYLQILAELGLIGFAIFAWFLTGIGVLAYRAFKRFGKLPMQARAAVIGVGLFLASSLVSSYSFRLIQNGFVFFFVLAVAAKLLFRNSAETNRVEISPKALRLGSAAAGVACLLLAVYCSVRVSSVVVTQKANYTPEVNAASLLYRTAIRLDDENPFALNNFGMRLFNEGRYSEAALYLAKSIDMGLAPSTNFSYLASAQSLAGDNSAAEMTMKRAALFYPHSVFVLTRYAALLKENGKFDEADEVFSAARRISPKAAKTWQAVITEGPKIASDKAVREADYIAVMDLQPQNSIYAVVAERLIRFPEERRFSMFSVESQKKDLDPQR